ncbi:MAG: type IV pilus modification protein PilV [Variovorax sp.]
MSRRQTQLRRISTSDLARAPGFGQPGKRQRGSSLIEVLIAILVLSFGLLAAAALQVSAMRNSQSSYEHAQMTLLTNGILDAMRSNLPGVSAGEYEIASWTCAAPGGGGSLAASDIANWITSVHAQINAGACAQITCAARQCTVALRWDDSRGTGGDSSQAYVIRSRL